MAIHEVREEQSTFTGVSASSPPIEDRSDEKSIKDVEAQDGNDLFVSTRMKQSEKTVADQYAQYNETGLKRALGPRQLSFISIGAAIGTGIFLGTGTALQNGGPLGLFLGFAVMATVVVSVLCCVGEMVSYLPVAGGHLTLAGRFVDPALAASASINYWLCWVLVLCAELSAAATLVGYWDDRINPGAWIAIFLVFVLFINIFGARIYGEAEFYFTMLKVITILGLIILGIVISAGGGPNHKSIGFQYWRNPGPFVQYKDIQGTSGRFLGFFSVLTQAAFSQIGSEMLALAAAETRNPRKALPTALNTVWIRISLFYLASVFIIGIIVSSADPGLGSSSTGSASPFVIAIKGAGIGALPSVVNAAILCSALSAACADLFTTSRALHSMACRGQVPRFFAYTTKHGIPLPALLMSWSFGLLALLSISNGSSKAFTFFVNLTSVSGVLTWNVIAFTYIRFRAGMKSQGLSRDILPWKTPFTIFMAYWVLLIVSLLVFFSGWTSLRAGEWDASAFFSNYTPLIWFPVFFIGFKLLWRTRFVRADEMDFISGLAAIEQDAAECDLEDEINRPSTLWGRFKRWWG